MAAVVTEGDGFGQRAVEAEGIGQRGGHLGDFERVREPGALMIGREDEDLGLAGQAAERRGVEDAVTVPFETGADGVGGLGPGPVTGADGPCRSRSEVSGLDGLTIEPARALGPTG
jgi:hypothetical protein